MGISFLLSDSCSCLIYWVKGIDWPMGYWDLIITVAFFPLRISLGEAVIENGSLIQNHPYLLETILAVTLLYLERDVFLSTLRVNAFVPARQCCFYCSCSRWRTIVLWENCWSFWFNLFLLFPQNLQRRWGMVLAQSSSRLSSQ